MKIGTTTLVFALADDHPPAICMSLKRDIPTWRCGHCRTGRILTNDEHCESCQAEIRFETANVRLTTEKLGIGS